MISAEKPGIIPGALTSFRESKSTTNPVECKIAIDGKKLAYGIGKKLGEEDLGGHEDEPTLQQRTDRYEGGMATIKEIHRLETTVDSFESMPTTEKKQLVEELKWVIAISSERIMELRKLIVQKEICFRNLLSKISEAWQQSKLAPAISFMKTQVIKSKSCITKMLNCIDSIAKHIAVLNGVGSFYRQGIGIEVDLSRQGNYMCLREYDGTELEQALEGDEIKQKCETWFKLRDGAVVTGSTFHRALGFDKLKDQREHYDKVFKGIVKEPTPEQQTMFSHGNENEIHALATFACKIMPVYFPKLIFREDGCTVLGMDTTVESYAVISGDGTCIDQNGESVVAGEFNCPMPDKQYTTDVYYKLPHYYGSQLLSQMAAKGCDTYANLCYTAPTSTFIAGSNDALLWTRIWELAKQLYGHGKTARPTRKLPESISISDQLKEFSSSSQFIAEFPSVRAIPCHCKTRKSIDEYARKLHLQSPNDIGEVNSESCLVTLNMAADEVHVAYQLLRRPAREILLGVISDLGRTVNAKHPDIPHVVPFMYYMAGPSLKMGAVKNILKEAISEATVHELDVKAVAFDGQFVELDVTNFDGYPPTMCRLDKMVWGIARKTLKAEQIKFFKDLNYTPDVNQRSASVLSERSIGTHVPRQSRRNSRRRQRWWGHKWRNTGLHLTILAWRNSQRPWRRSQGNSAASQLQHSHTQVQWFCSFHEYQQWQRQHQCNAWYVHGYLWDVDHPTRNKWFCKQT